MRPTARMARQPGQYLGWWGQLGGQPQKGIVTYSMSPNRQKPFAGAMHAAVFNTWRRFYAQVFYWAPPAIIAYLVIDWAERKNKFLNSKPGRMMLAEQEGGEE